MGFFPSMRVIILFYFLVQVHATILFFMDLYFKQGGMLYRPKSSKMIIFCSCFETSKLWLYTFWSSYSVSLNKGFMHMCWHIKPSASCSSHSYIRFSLFFSGFHFYFFGKFLMFIVLYYELQIEAYVLPTCFRAILLWTRSNLIFNEEPAGPMDFCLYTQFQGAKISRPDGPWLIQI